MNQDWEDVVKGCKKINKNFVVKKNTISTTGKILETLKVRKYENFNENFDKETNILDYDYKLEKNESLGIDNNTDRKLKAGKIPIDLRIDFHGMTLNEAKDCLEKTIENAYQRGLRLILFITGKGRGTKEDRESIKQAFSRWMKAPNISSRVIKYTDAQQKDGGTGAVYVLLKMKKLINY